MPVTRIRVRKLININPIRELSTNILGIASSYTNVVHKMRLQWIQSIVHPCTTKDSDLVRVRGNDLPCIFPFKINGRRYDGCTTDDEVMPWCSVQTDDEGNHVPSDEENGKTWGYCDIKKCFKANPDFVPDLFHPLPETDKTCHRERVCLQHDECPELLEISREEQRPFLRANGCNKKARGYCCPQGKYFMCYRYEICTQKQCVRKC